MKYYTDPTSGEKVPIRKTHKFRNFVVLPALGLALIIGVTVAATGGGGGTDPTTPVDPVAGTQTVEYRVTGTGSSSVTYSEANFQISQDTSATLPWTKTVTVDGGLVGTSMTLSAQHMAGTGPISCSISVDGQVVATNTSQGQYAVVTCSSTP